MKSFPSMPTYSSLLPAILVPLCSFGLLSSDAKEAGPGRGSDLTAADHEGGADHRSGAGAAVDEEDIPWRAMTESGDALTSHAMESDSRVEGDYEVEPWPLLPYPGPRIDEALLLRPVDTYSRRPEEIYKVPSEDTYVDVGRPLTPIEADLIQGYIVPLPRSISERP